MQEQIDKLTSGALEAIGSAPDLAALDDLRVRWLGRKGELVDES